jgi:hypothetical protein
MTAATLRDFVRRHPAGSYFVLTFAISRGGFFLVGGRGFFAGTSWQDDPLFVFAVTALLIGSPVAGGCVDWSRQGTDRLP